MWLHGERQAADLVFSKFHALYTEKTRLLKGTFMLKSTALWRFSAALSDAPRRNCSKILKFCAAFVSPPVFYIGLHDAASVVASRSPTDLFYLQYTNLTARDVWLNAYFSRAELQKKWKYSFYVFDQVPVSRIFPNRCRSLTIQVQQRSHCLIFFS